MKINKITESRIFDKINRRVLLDYIKLIKKSDFKCLIKNKENI